jgi:alpha/beta superfamily hydrolase
MQNKVVHTLARAAQDQHVTSVRFNFRGVGASEGKHGDGVGESEDAAVVADWATARDMVARVRSAASSLTDSRRCAMPRRL